LKTQVPLNLAYRLMHPRLVVLVTSRGRDGKANIITLAWSVPTSFSPPMVAISVVPERYSHTHARSSGDHPGNQPLNKPEVVARYLAVRRHLTRRRRPFDRAQGDEYLPKTAPLGFQCEPLGEGGCESLDVEDQYASIERVAFLVGRG
jgi:flavin reductase (DIM6/NTAB) family NADH-FMN oxidoreductase RutF